ncbi:MAG: CinA family protein [Proteobacteria bacterium]|nr:CinA family protein [Pseudomonadota bacterium]
MTENNFFLSQQLATLLERYRLTLSVAESCTGGGLAYQLTAVPGCSAWFECGLVVYSNSSKIKLLGVEPQTLEKYGAVSSQTALEMAKCCIKQCNTSLSLSITGIAGPGGGSNSKPVGTVFMGLADQHGFCEARLNNFSSGRHQIREDSISFALQWLLEHVTGLFK